MYECDICLAKIKKRNKNKHKKSMKHRYFLSNMIVNIYIVKNIDIKKIQDFLLSYCDEHKKKFNQITVTIIWNKKNDMIINKISIPRTITLRRTHMFKPDVFEIPIYVKVSEREFLDIVNRNYAYIISDEIGIIFVSKLKEITLQHYMEQPRSMLCRKLERNYIAENDTPNDDRDFDYNFLP